MKLMSLDDLKQQVTAHCLMAKYWVSDKNTFDTKGIPASDVLALDGDNPHLHIDQVGAAVSVV